MNFFRLIKILASIYLMTALTCASANAQQQVGTSDKEQASFGSDFGEKGAMEQPTTLPEDVFQQLLEFEEGTLKHCLEDEPNLEEHFAASRININSDAVPDLIVQATSLCFMGAHSTTWWIFSNTTAKFGLRILPSHEPVFSGRGDFLNVLNTKTNEFRDISISNFAGAGTQLYEVIYKFDGQVYQPRVCTVKNDGGSPVYVRCEQ